MLIFDKKKLNLGNIFFQQNVTKNTGFENLKTVDIGQISIQLGNKIFF